MSGVCTKMLANQAGDVVTGQRVLCMDHLASKSSVIHLKNVSFDGAKGAFVPLIA